MPDSLIILHSESSTGWGGQEIRVFTELTWMRRRGHTAGLIVPPGSPLGERAERADIPVAWIPMPRALDPWAVTRMAKRLRREGAQVLVTHSSVDAWTGGLAARLIGVPVVRMRHLSVPLQGNPLSRAVYTTLCDKIVTTGEAIRALLVQQLGIPPAKVVSVPTGVDLEMFHPSRVDSTRFRKELGLKSGTPLLGMIAVLRSWKGHLVFLQALRQLRDKGIDVQAVLVGEGPFRKVVQEAIRCHGLAAHVHLMGHREDVADILSGLDVVVSASTAAEGVPQALLQALAMRRPVVASDVGGTPEVIRPGETGWLVPPGDPEALAGALEEALADRPRAQRLGETGRKIVEAEYSLQRMGEQMEELYWSLTWRRGSQAKGSRNRRS
ncbi:MAG TPA: glycosyltransferase family 4 protein [Candidatus Methylomirabilis sp.]|nr:glycosyltransferase family 4 protein [Candidatus Methylomirabilis sp.]